MRTGLRWALWPLLWCCLGTSGLVAQEWLDGEDVPWFREHPERDKQVMIITGVAATPEIRQRFRDWSFALHEVFQHTYGYGEEQITLLLDEAETDSRVAAGTWLEDIESQFARLSAAMQPGDQLTLIFIGHGSSRFGDPKFNNAGPDITGQDLARILNEDFSEQDVVVINAFSSSYEFSRQLSAPGRIIISANRSPAERFDPVFPRFMIEGLLERSADMDRNGRVSLLELFNYASRNVAQWYRNQDRLATEHAVLDDTGNGRFSMEAGPGQSDGLLAEIAYLDMVREEGGKQGPEAAALQAQMQDLERSVFLLRARKDNFLERDYWDQLEDLLLELARTTRAYHELP